MSAISRAQRRLVAFLALSVLLVAGGGAAALTSQIAARKRASLDTQVERGAVAANAILSEDSKHPGQIDVSQFTSTPRVQGDPSIAVLDKSGNEVAGEDFTGAAATRAALDLSTRDLEAAVTAYVAGSRVRMAAQPVIGNSGDTIGTVVAFQPTGATDSAIHQATVLIFGGAGAAWLAIVAIGWLLTARAVAPALRGAAREQAFLADAAHELRTPIAVIRARAEHALRLEGATAARADMNAVLTAADNAARTLTDMLELARLDARRGTVQRDRLRLDALAEAVADDWRERAEKAGVELAVDTPAQVFVDGDERLLSRALANLIENAIRHGRAGGIVRIGADQLGGKARLTVADRGPGIAPGSSGQIFDRFHRASSAGGGAGLGLPIAQLIAQAHGGQLELAESAQDETGATFVLTLPLAIR